MAENPRMTFWGPRIETVPQGFKERLKKQQEAAKKVEPAPEPEVVDVPAPKKRK